MRAADDLGKLLLRLCFGGLLMMYGYYKITDGSKAWELIADWLSDNGLPDWLRYGVILTEGVAPFLIVLGFWTRAAGLTVAFSMSCALYLVHSNQWGLIGPHGGWEVEQPLRFLLGGLVIALLGSGRYSIDGRFRREA